MHVLINAINDNDVPRGPDRYLLELLPHLLADPSLRFTLAYAPWQSAFRDADFGQRVTKLLLNPPRRPALRLLWQASGFVRHANRLNPDLVFLPNSIWTPGLGAPSVLVAHDFLQFRTPEKFGQLKAALLRRVIRLAVARATRIIAVSQFTAQDAVDLAGADRRQVVVITEGGPEAESRTVATPEKVFLFVGKIERTKGVDTFIKAFQASGRLRASGFQAHIIGPDGNAAEDIKALITKDSAGIVRHGFVSEQTLAQAYARCRAFVFPSTAEGFGLVLLEAMARGAPVIATRATSLPEVVGQAGVLVEPGDVPALTAAMEDIAFDDRRFENLQAAGYARLNDFSWQTAGQATTNLFHEVANGK